MVFGILVSDMYCSQFTIFLNAKLAGAPTRFCLYMQSGILIGSALLWLAYFVTRVVHFDKACLNIKNFKIQIDGNVL